MSTALYDLDLEKTFLGWVLLHPNSLDDVSNIIKSIAFYESSHRVIYEGIDELYRAVEPISVDSLKVTLKRNGSLKKAKGSDYLQDLIDECPRLVNIASVAQTIQEFYVRRQLKEQSKKISDRVDDLTIPVTQILNDSESEMMSLSENFYIEEIKSPGDVIDSVFEDILRNAQLGKVPGIGLPFNDLSNVLNGLKEAGLYAVMGRPSQGKTTFTLQIAEHAATIEDKVVLYVSLETTTERIALNQLSRLSAVPIRRLERGSFNDEEAVSVMHNIEVVRSFKKNLKVDDSFNFGIQEFKSKVRKFKKENGLDVIFIDHVNLVDSTGDEYKSLKVFTREIKLFAKELNIPIVLLCQLNRNVENRTDKRPQMSDARGSGSIEEDMDVMIGLYRDEYYNKDTKFPGIAEVIILKNKLTGYLGTVYLGFKQEIGLFYDLTKEEKKAMFCKPENPYAKETENSDANGKTNGYTQQQKLFK